MARKDYKLKNERDKYRSPRWIQKNKEFPIFVQVSNSYVGNREPELNIWRQQKDQKSMATYIISGKKFKTKKAALTFARNWMNRH